MKHRFKKILCLVLSLMMIIPSAALVANAENVSGQEVELEITNAQEFAWGDTVTFDIVIRNNSGSRITNVDIKTEPKGTSKYFTKTDDSVKMIDFITPGATRNVTVSYSTAKISDFQSFFRAILTFFSRVFSRFTQKYSISKTLKVGKSKIMFGFDVDYEISSQVNTGEVNLDDPDPDVEIYSFNTDTFDVLVGETKTVTFTSEIFSSSPIEDGAVSVFDENNNKIGSMNDKGINGDRTANDGLYTAKIDLHSNQRKLVNYHAECCNILSGEVEICFYTEISHDEYDRVSNLVKTIANMSTSQEVISYLSNSNLISEYDYDSNSGNVYYTTNCGIKGCWTNFGDGNNKGEKSSNAPKYLAKSAADNSLSDNIESSKVSTVINKNVLVLRPYASDPIFTEVSKNTGDRIASYIGGACTVLDDEDVTIDAMKNVYKYGTVIMDSHGLLAESSMHSSLAADDDPYMIIGQELNSGNGSSSADFQAGRTVICNDRLAVGGKFFNTYLNGHNCADTVFYLGTCYSMHNYTISDALISHGATAVYGFSEPVGFTYCDNILTAIFTSFLDNSGTAIEAYNYAGEKHGFFYGGDCEFRYDGKDDYSYFGSGGISGVIKDASTSRTVANALIRVYSNDVLVASARTDSNGMYNISLPAGNYIVRVSAGNFKTTKMSVVVRANAITYNETFLLIFNGISDGYANGRTYNAITGQRLQNVRINIRSSWNNYEGQIIKTLTSDDNGYYEVELPAGLYTFECYKDGFITTYKNVLMFTFDFASQDISLAPELEEGYYRVVLTWGVNPSDLDSHLFGKTDDYSYRVYYGNKNGYNSNGDVVANLDVDDTTSYGPETTTFYVNPNGEYDFYIDWFSGSGTWATSGGKIEVYNGAYLINTYFVPNVSNRSGSWKVFSIHNGVYTDYNYIIPEDIY